MKKNEPFSQRCAVYYDILCLLRLLCRLDNGIYLTKSPTLSEALPGLGFPFL